MINGQLAITTFFDRLWRIQIWSFQKPDAPHLQNRDDDIAFPHKILCLFSQVRRSRKQTSRPHIQSRVLMSRFVGHRRANDIRIGERIGFFCSEELHFEELVADRAAFGNGINADLAGAIIADSRDHRGDKCRRGRHTGAAFFDIGHDSLNTVCRHHLARIAQQVEIAQQAVGDERQERIEFEAALARSIGD